MNRFGFTKKSPSPSRLAQRKGEDPVRKYEVEKQTLNSANRAQPSKAEAGLAGSSSHPRRPNLDLCPEADSVKNVTRGRPPVPVQVRAPRRSRSANSSIREAQPEPEHPSRSDWPEGLRRLRISKSLVPLDLEVHGNHKNGSDINSDRTSSIGWYLNQFGYRNSKRPTPTPTSFGLNYYGLTGREYLEICRFVESQLGDQLLEGRRETDEEIIAILIAFAVDMKYPVPITRTLLIAPMAPAVRTRTICFLFWLCSRVHKIKFRGSENEPKSDEIYFEGASYEQIACRVFLQIRKTEKFDFAQRTEEYREYQRKLLSTDLKTTEDLLKKRNEMKETLAKEKKRYGRRQYEFQVLKEEDKAVSQRLVELKQKIQAKRDATSKLRELFLQDTRLSKEVKELEEMSEEERTKAVIKEIKKKIQAVEATVQEQLAIQKRSKEMMEVKEDLKIKLSRGCEEFKQNNVCPALDDILKAIGMEPIELGLPENCENFLEQMKAIEEKVEVAKEVMKMMNGKDNDTSDSFDEDEVFGSYKTSNSEHSKDTIIPAGPSGSQSQALDLGGQVANGEAADGDEEEQERPRPSTAPPRKHRKPYLKKN